jgi:non-specific serine/threonine protein kinase
LTQKQLAHQIGCATITLRKIESGERFPSVQNVKKVAEIFNIAPEEQKDFLRFARGDWSLAPARSHDDSPWLASHAAPRSNLPFQLSSFVGRSKELLEIAGLIASNRLATLVGPGGVGKTRLSLKTGEQVLRDYAHGVWFVELAPIADPLLLPRTIAIAIGLQDVPQRPVMDMLSDYLREKNMLIILDNCEHILDACAQIADFLLKKCPHLKILATSREALGIVGEAVYQVPSLQLPSMQQFLEDFRNYESIRLFEERARLVKKDFSLTAENISSIVEMCTRLDGIPLAIELAAGRVNMFSIDQIVAKLHASFDLLIGGSRTALPRHQTLQAAINWSYDLLSPAEQVLFRRLSVFVNDWTPEAAEFVCTDANIKSDTVLDLLTQLVKKSLVITVELQGKVRYHMLETIRQYAYEKLGAAFEEESTHSQHLNYFLKLSEQIEQELAGPQQVEWFALANSERHNLRATLEHACRVNIEAGLYIAGRLELFWTHLDSNEGRHWLAKLLLNPEAKAYPHARAKALHTQSELLFDDQQYEEAQAAAEESLALFRAVGDPSGEVDGLFSLARMNMLGSSPNPEKGSELAHQALARAQTLGDIRRQADALDLLGWDHRDFKRAFSHWEEAITLYRQIGHWSRLARSLSSFGFFLLMDGQLDTAQKYLNESKLFLDQLNFTATGHLLASLAQIAILRGDYEQARTYFLQDAETSSELGRRMYYLWARARLGFTELLTGNITEARQIFTETVRDFQKDGSQGGVVFTLEGMSSLYVAVDKPDVAARLIGWADATRMKISDTRPKLEQAEVDKLIADCLAKMGVVAYITAYDEGRRLTLDEAVLYALDS